MKFNGQTFVNQKIDLDFQEFNNCEFNKCTLIYHAYGVVTLNGCSFKDVDWTLSDAARNTLTFMMGLYHGAGEGGRQVVEKTFENVRKGVEPTK